MEQKMDEELEKSLEVFADQVASIICMTGDYFDKAILPLARKKVEEKDREAVESWAEYFLEKNESKGEIS